MREDFWKIFWKYLIKFWNHYEGCLTSELRFFFLRNYQMKHTKNLEGDHFKDSGKIPISFLHNYQMKHIKH